MAKKIASIANLGWKQHVWDGSSKVSDCYTGEIAKLQMKTFSEYLPLHRMKLTWKECWTMNSITNHGVVNRMRPILECALD